MLSRPATKISLTADDVAAYEQRQMARAARNKSQELGDSSDGDIDQRQASTTTPEMTPTDQARAAKAKMTRDQRIGVGATRS